MVFACRQNERTVRSPFRLLSPVHSIKTIHTASSWLRSKERGRLTMLRSRAKRLCKPLFGYQSPIAKTLPLFDCESLKDAFQVALYRQCPIRTKRQEPCTAASNPCVPINSQAQRGRDYRQPLLDPWLACSEQRVQAKERRRSRTVKPPVQEACTSYLGIRYRSLFALSHNVTCCRINDGR